VCGARVRVVDKQLVRKKKQKQKTTTAGTKSRKILKNNLSFPDVNIQTKKQSFKQRVHLKIHNDIKKQSFEGFILFSLIRLLV